MAARALQRDLAAANQTVDTKLPELTSSLE
jgi:hypothetical protein